MNYYIQGNKEKADQIKAAFKKLGCDVTGFDMCNDNILFFTYKLEGGGKVISTTNANLYTADIIKTHPDYKELELSVRPKFKIGDWIACDDDSFTLSIKSVRDVNYYFHQGGSLPIKDIDEHYHLWTIADAKDGDVLIDTLSGTRDVTILFRGINADDSINSYCGWNGYNFRVTTNGAGYGTLSSSQYEPATKVQRNILFQKMKEEGYVWNDEKKELKKIQPHYDISNFKPKQWVLVRQGDGCIWRLDMFSHLKEGSVCQFECVGNSMVQCIPFEGNEHLLGTTDMPSEEYINW